MTTCLIRIAGLVCAALAAACASKSGAPGPVVTKIDYDSTRDGPVMPRPEDTGPPDPAKCAHVWEAIPRATHYYQDPSSELQQLSLCTPVRCSKCGLVRHECQPRTRRAR